MVTRTPLVLINGRPSLLPDGDNIVVPDGTYGGIVVSGTDWNLNPATPIALTAGIEGTGLATNGAAGTVRVVAWESAGSTRWAMRATAAAESGSNVGSNIELRAYDDSGASLGAAFGVKRSTQVVDFSKLPTLADAPLGGPATFPMRPAAGVYVANGINGSALGTVAQAANRVTISPFIPSFDMTIDQVAISVSTALAASNAKVVIYNSNADNQPSTVLTESADISCAVAGTITSTLAVAFVAGRLYWIGVRSSGTQTLRSLTAAALPVLSYTNAATPVIQGVLTKTETYASAAATWSYASSQHSNLTMPIVLMRVA